MSRLQLVRLKLLSFTIIFNQRFPGAKSNVVFPLILTTRFLKHIPHDLKNSAVGSTEELLIIINIVNRFLRRQ